MVYNTNIEHVFYILEIRYKLFFQERIFMCKECNMTFCSPPCPNYTGYIPGGGSVKVCSCCENDILPDDFYYSIFGENLCKECVENLSMQEFSEIFGFSEISYLIEELGGEYRRD